MASIFTDLKKLSVGVIICRTGRVLSVLMMIFTSGCSGETPYIIDQDIPVIMVQVLDEQDKPIPGVKTIVRKVILAQDGAVLNECGIWNYVGQSSDNGWISLENRLTDSYGECQVGHKHDKLGYEVFFTGGDIAPTMVRASFDEFPERVKVEKGVEVIVKLAGAVPEGKPRVVLGDNTFCSLNEGSKPFIDLKEVGQNVWKCVLKEGEQYVVGWLSDKMYGYCSEPFLAYDALEFIFSPDMPSTFEYDLTCSVDNVRVFPAKVFLSKKGVKNGRASFLSLGSKIISKPGVAIFNGLAKGSYEIRAIYAHDLSRWHPSLYDVREITLRPGCTNRFEPLYPEIDTIVKNGDMTILGTLYGPDQKPLTGKAIHLIPYYKKGPSFDLFYSEIVTDKEGGFEFRGVRPDLVGVSVESSNASVFLSQGSLSKNAIITMDLFEGLDELPLQVGDTMGDILVEWQDGSSGNLMDDYKGKIVVLEIWATWCPPCWKMRPVFNALARQLSATNNTEVEFVAVATDSDRNVWKKALHKIACDKVRDGWFNQKENSYIFKRPIPFYIIIDRETNICAAGNDIDIESVLKKINK